MEPPTDAVWRGDGWHYSPAIAPIPELVLGSSGAGNSVWTLCGEGRCITLGAEPDQPIKLWPAEEGATCEPSP